MFTLDSTHYSRRLPVHLKYLIPLENNSLYIFQEFHNGNFVIIKSIRKFSAILTDQAHEQNNATIKGDGGAVGLFDSNDAG